MEPDAETPEQGDNGPLHPLAVASMVIGMLGLAIPLVVPSLLAIWLGKCAQRQLESTHRQMSGGRQATAGVVTGILGISFFAVLLVVFVVLVLPSMTERGGDYRQRTEKENLERLAGGMLMYAMQQHGSFPATFGDLARSRIVPPGTVYVTPGPSARAPYNADDIDGGETHYTYHLPRVQVDALPTPGRTVLLSSEQLDGIVTVAFADGRVVQVDAADLQSAAATHGWLLDGASP